MRRLFHLVVLIALLLASIVQVAAQDATPASEGSLLDELGLPEFLLSTSDGATLDLPAELAAGRYHVVLENQSDLDIDLEFLQLPEGLGPDDYVALVEESESSPVFVPPDFFFEMVFNGGVASPPGGTGAAVLDLAPGEWTMNLRAYDPATGELINTPRVLTVTGDMPAVDEITGAIDVSLADMSFELPDSVVAGPQIWSVANVGEQVHHIELAGVPDGTTTDQVIELFMAYFTVLGTPAATEPGATPIDPVLGFDQFRIVYSTPLLSAGQGNWYEVDLEPGTYVMMCFLPDPEGTPHFMLGMIEVITVE